MNKGTLEHVTQCKVKRLSRESWALFNKEDEAIFTDKGKKESLVFQKLHDAFWKVRRQEIFERDGFKCIICSSRLGLSVDHQINRSQGGTHDPSNLGTKCLQCHEKKTLLRPGWK